MAFLDDPAQPQRLARRSDAGRKPDRTAAEHQDQVVQAIFAVGLRLQNTALITVDPLVRRQIERACNDLDDVIHAIRDTAFGLNRRPAGRTLHADIVHLCEHGPSPADVAVNGRVDGAPESPPQPGSENHGGGQARGQNSGNERSP